MARGVGSSCCIGQQDHASLGIPILTFLSGIVCLAGVDPGEFRHLLQPNWLMHA